MFTLYWIVFAPAQKPYRIGILFTHNNGDFGAISVTERSCAAPIPKVERHISDRCSYLPDSLFAPAQKPYRIGILFTRKNGDFGAISVTERSCAALIPKEEHHISGRLQTADCRVGTKCRLGTKCRMQTADCRLSTKCRLTRKTVFFFFLTNMITYVLSRNHCSKAIFHGNSGNLCLFLKWAKNIIYIQVEIPTPLQVMQLR